jgi:multiple sugar transport system substrate-binding protein
VFAWPGYLQPLDRFVTPELRQDLLPSIVAQGTYDDRLYSLGQFDSGLGLWGNRRYLNAAGVRLPTVQFPWDLAEFEAAMEKLNAVPGVEYALNLSTYIGPSEFFAYAYAPIVQGFGGDLIDRRDYRSAKGVLDGPESVVAMQHFQHWFAKGWSRDVRDRVDDFERGKAALSWTGHWKYPDFHGALGDDLVLMPLPDLGHGIKTGIGSWSWGISSTCSNPAGAWAFLEFLLSSDEILRMTNANGAVPARYSALARSPLYAEGGPLRLFAEQLGAGLGVPRPATPAYSTISRAFAQAVSAIIAGGNIQLELSKAARIIDADIARHRGYPRR